MAPLSPSAASRLGVASGSLRTTRADESTREVNDLAGDTHGEVLSHRSHRRAQCGEIGRRHRVGELTDVVEDDSDPRLADAWVDGSSSIGSQRWPGTDRPER
jgi:hypothetical protein